MTSNFAIFMNNFGSIVSRVGSGALAAPMDCVLARTVSPFWHSGVPSATSDVLMAHAKGKTVRSAVGIVSRMS